MNVKKSALYGITLSTAIPPFSAQAATDTANEIYAFPDTFSFQTADGNIVCRARTINSGDLFDIDLRGRPRLPTRWSCLCILAKQHTQPRLPRRHPRLILLTEPEIQDIAGKRKSRNTLTCRLNVGGINCNSTESPTKQDYH